MAGANEFDPYKIENAAVYDRIMAKDVIHISEAKNFAALLARARAGAEVIMENGKRPVAVLHAAEPARRSISECIALAKRMRKRLARPSSWTQTLRKT